MTSNRGLYGSYSLDLTSNNNQKDEDSISLKSLNIESTIGLHYLSSNLNAFLSNRQTSDKRSIINHKDSNGNGLIINGSLFDGQVFQTTRPSYILDYRDTPQDLNKFLQGHNLSSTSSQLDAHLFKLAFIITLSDWCVDKELLLEHCPQDDNHENILEEISSYKRFCFPELTSKRTQAGQIFHDPSTYVFTRTLSDGQVEYGYCRRLTKDYNQITKFPIVICIVSSYSYFKLYDAILNELTTAYISNESECGLLIQSFYSKPLPLPTLNSSGIVCILNDSRVFFYVCPRDDRLNHDYFSTLLSCLSPNHIVHLFESILSSKRILIFSHYPSKLSKCCLALAFLIYPFIWPYSFVSIMPSSWLHDLLDSPCPYIYGCLYDTMQQISSIIDNDIIRVDLDLNTIESHTDNTHVLPLNLRQTLESSLEYLIKFRLIRVNTALINIAASEACLHVFTELFHRLPEFFKREKTLVTSVQNDGHFSVCADYFQRHDSGIDLQSLVSVDIQPMVQNEHKQEENRFGYDFQSEEFFRVQPSAFYVSFLRDFSHGMIFLKFLDDYQRPEDATKKVFSLFSQRLNERRQMTCDDLSINPVIRFRQTFDLLEKQTKQISKQTNPSFSKFLKKIFE